MTAGPIVAVLVPDADLRWRKWQARGAEGDRRRAIVMGTLGGVVAFGVTAWLLIQLI